MTILEKEIHDYIMEMSRLYGNNDKEVLEYTDMHFRKKGIWINYYFDNNGYVEINAHSNNYIDEAFMYIPCDFLIEYRKEQIAKL